MQLFSTRCKLCRLGTIRESIVPHPLREAPYQLHSKNQKMERIAILSAAPPIPKLKARRATTELYFHANLPALLSAPRLAMERRNGTMQPMGVKSSSWILVTSWSPHRPLRRAKSKWDWAQIRVAGAVWVGRARKISRPRK